jgi:hypothetical protein
VNAQPKNWLSFALAVIGSAIAIVAVALLLNFNGDCAQGVTDCGGLRRRASFVVLALGLVWVGYLVARFIRSPEKFR